MPWFNVDDGLAFHRKVVAAGNSAMGLWVRSGSWSARELTDGFVPDHMAALLGTATQARRLVQAGLWHRDDTRRGFQFHEYTENGRNPSREVVLKKREEAADRKRKQRTRNGHFSGDSQVDGSGHAGQARESQGESQGESQPPPPLPSPPLTTKKTSSSSRRLSPPREDVEKLCVLLADRVEENRLKRPEITQAWRTEARLMLDRDERDPVQAARLIEWATNDEFWSGNILSMPKFRKQYDQLLMRARREQQAQQRAATTKPSTTDQRVIEAERLKDNPDPRVLAYGSGPQFPSGPELMMLPGGAA